MFHEPPNQFLYSAYKIYVEHTDGLKTKTGTATRFILEIGKSTPWVVTNRHVIDIDYKQATAKYKDFKLSKFIITGRKADDKEYSFQLHENTEFYFHDDYENDIVLIQAYMYLVEGQSLHWHFSMEHLGGKPTQIDPLIPQQSDPRCPFQNDPLIPAQNDPL